jgi:hypothetical protein
MCWLTNCFHAVSVGRSGRQLFVSPADKERYWEAQNKQKSKGLSNPKRCLESWQHGLDQLDKNPDYQAVTDNYLCDIALLESFPLARHLFLQVF